jgi:hypothetical protein
MSYEELFRMCGFEANEIEKEKPRIEKALAKLELGPRDIESALDTIPKNFDISLKGVRSVLRIWLEELLNLMLAKEEGKKLIYGTAPGFPCELLEAIRVAAPERVYCANPELLLGTVLDALFGKHDELVEVGERSGLAPGFAHCSVGEAKVGGVVKKFIPPPDLAICMGIFCDQTPETEEMISEVYGFPEPVYVDNCLDLNWDEWDKIPLRKIKYLAGQMRKALDKAQEVIGVPITDEHIQKARVNLFQTLNGVMSVYKLLENDPPPISVGDIMPIVYLYFNPVAGRDKVDAACRLICEEGMERIAQGYGVVPKGAPRVLFTWLPNVDNSVVHIAEKAGLVIIMQVVLWPIEAQKKPKTVQGPLLRIAENYLRNPYICGYLPINMQWIREASRYYNADGVFWYWMYNCRVQAALNPIALRKWVTEELGLPILILEGDFHSTHEYSGEAARTRIETFAEVVKARKAARERDSLSCKPGKSSQLT